MGEFLTVLLCRLLQPMQVNIFLHIWMNFLQAFHVYFTAHPGEYLNCASGWIASCPSMCSFTAHPGEYLSAHLDEFLTGLPCVLLQPIQVNLLYGIVAILTSFPFVLLQSIQVNIYLRIWMNFLLAFHVCFYCPSMWISYWASMQFLRNSICTFTVHQIISHWPPMCIVAFLLAFHLCYYSKSS